MATPAEVSLLLACMKHSSKPDFKLVAEELGCTYNQAYHRHYSLMRKLNSSNAGAGAAPKTPTKRARTTPNKQASDVKDLDFTRLPQDDEDLGELPPPSPAKKAKAVKKEAGTGVKSEKGKFELNFGTKGVAAYDPDMDEDDEDSDAATVRGGD